MFADAVFYRDLRTTTGMLNPMDGGWGYLIGASVTIVGVAASQWGQGRREDRRWKNERNAERERWDREQSLARDEVKRASRERWADQRRDTYVEFITVARTWLDLAEADLKAAQERGTYLPRMLGTSPRRHDYDQRVRELLSSLELWATGDLHLAGRKLLFALEWADLSVDVRRPEVVPLGEGNAVSNMDLRQLVLAAKGDYRRFVRAVRADLGLLNAKDEERMRQAEMRWGALDTEDPD